MRAKSGTGGIMGPVTTNIVVMQQRTRHFLAETAAVLYLVTINIVWLQEGGAGRSSPSTCGCRCRRRVRTTGPTRSPARTSRDFVWSWARCTATVAGWHRTTAKPSAGIAVRLTRAIRGRRPSSAGCTRTVGACSGTVWKPSGGIAVQRNRAIPGRGSNSSVFGERNGPTAQRMRDVKHAGGGILRQGQTRASPASRTLHSGYCLHAGGARAGGYEGERAGSVAASRTESIFGGRSRTR